MAIYIQSRGASQEQDYRWLRIDGEEQKSENPPIGEELFIDPPGVPVSIPSLIDSQTFSLVLARSRRRLLLLITGLKARPERIDYQQRQIRNSIVWLYPDSPENERLIRGLTILALDNERLFATDIDKAIELGSAFGFKVRLDGIEAVEAKAREQHLPDHLDPDINSIFLKIGKNPESRPELIGELSTYPFPAEGERFLVVVTSIKTEDALTQARVWRGLSNRVEAENWIKRIPDNTFFRRDEEPDRGERFFDKIAKKFWIAIIAIVGLLFIILILILAWIIIPMKQTEPIPQQTPTPSQKITSPNGRQNQELQKQETSPPIQLTPESSIEQNP